MVYQGTATVANVFGNTASTSNDDIYGDYTACKRDSRKAVGRTRRSAATFQESTKAVGAVLSPSRLLTGPAFPARRDWVCALWTIAFR
jgi:hypothetical protein